MTGDPAELRAEIMRWFWIETDQMMDRYPDSMTAAYEPLWDAIDTAQANIVAELCKLFGHEPERDHCLMPEHDFCHYCRARIPHGYCTTRLCGNPDCPKPKGTTR